MVVGYGNGNAFRSQILSSGAIVKNKFYYRFSGSYKKSDGVITNETLNEEVNFLRDLTVRGQLTYHLSNRFSANLSYQLMDVEGGATYYSHSNSGMQLDADDFDNNIIDADQRGESSLKNSFGYLKLEYAFNKMALKSVTSYNDADRNHRGDLDFGPLDILRQFQDSNSETFNQEVRLNSTNGDSKLSWDLGVFYQNSDKLLLTDATADLGFFADPPAPTGSQSLFSRLSDFTNNFETVALFGFADYKLTDRFTMSFGLRYDNDQITQENRLNNTTTEKSQAELQPKLSLACQATDNLLIFANYGRGYRSGGFNAAATELFDSEYEGETSDNYEIGLKTSSMNDRLIFNLTGFYVNYNNQQQYIVGPNSEGALLIGNFNFEETTVTGIEADVKFRTFKYLDIIGGYGLSRSTIDKSSTNSSIDRSGFEGNKTPFIPQTTFNVALQSNFDISDNIDFNGFVNMTNKGKIYWHEDNNDVAEAYSLLNARLGIIFSKKYGLSIWSDNLTDVEYFQEYSAGEVSGSAAGDLGWIGQPRTFGLDLSIKF
ncbi:MAG: TonB-dependent receptor [Ekhidna sp.]|nr:TonB-dependent receptor [Ekhidna sp.]